MNRSNMEITISFRLLILCSFYSVISGVNYNLLIKYIGQSLLNKNFNWEYNFLSQDATQLFVYEQEEREKLVVNLRREKEEHEMRLQASAPLPDLPGLIPTENKTMEKKAKKLEEAESRLKTDPLCNGDELELTETCLSMLENSYYKKEDVTFTYDGGDRRKPACDVMNVVIVVEKTKDKKKSTDRRTVNERDQVRGVHERATTSKCTPENQNIQTDKTSHVNEDPSDQAEKEEVRDAEQKTEGLRDDEDIKNVDEEENPDRTTEDQKGHDTKQEQTRMTNRASNKGIEAADDNKQRLVGTGAKCSKIYKRFMLACPMTVTMNARERVDITTLFFSATDQYDGKKERINAFVFESTIDFNNPNVREALLDMTTVRVSRLQINKKRTSKPKTEECSKHREALKDPSEDTKGEHPAKT